MSLNQYSKEQLKEMSLIELAYEILSSSKQTISFSDLMKEITQLQDLSEEDVTNKIAQFYTDMNVDGRFTSLGENRWGLKSWYPVDQIEDEILPVDKPKKKKSKKALEEDELEDFDEIEEEELDYDDLDDFEEEEEDLVDDDDDDTLLEDDDDEDFDEILEEDGFVIDADGDDEDLDDEVELDDEEEDENL